MISAKYFTAINQLSTINQTQVDLHLKTGYERILSRKYADGSFQFLGNSRYKSIWLTAYVAKCLTQVEGIMFIDANHIKTAFDFLKKYQSPSHQVTTNKKNISGGFIEFGVERKAGIVLTAFVAISFLENSKFISDYRDVVDKALNFIDRNLNYITSNYEFAISAYALALGKHDSAKLFLDHLSKKAKNRDGKKFWNVNFDDDKNKVSNDISDKIEIASYALLSFIKARRESEVRPIMLWIISQIQQNDGAFSKKDSVVTAQALSEIASIYFTSEVNIDLALFYESNERTDIHIDNSNAKNPINFNLPTSTRGLTVAANGTGFVLLEVLYNYEQTIGDFSERFALQVTVKTSDDEKVLHLTICTALKIDEDIGDASNMKISNAMMEVKLPSGYVYDTNSNNFLVRLKIKVSRIHRNKFLTNKKLRAENRNPKPQDDNHSALR